MFRKDLCDINCWQWDAIKFLNYLALLVLWHEILVFIRRYDQFQCVVNIKTGIICVFDYMCVIFTSTLMTVSWAPINILNWIQSILSQVQCSPENNKTRHVLRRDCIAVKPKSIMHCTVELRAFSTVSQAATLNCSGFRSYAEVMPSLILQKRRKGRWERAKIMGKNGSHGSFLTIAST